MFGHTTTTATAEAASASASDSDSDEEMLEGKTEDDKTFRNRINRAILKGIKAEFVTKPTVFLNFIHSLYATKKTP